ncbi:hypothetical protein ACTZWT_06060 [Rhodopseudomonas sp. NSM]|uniref:hypothetical protein n=1 Tax=Rhodopseudomonas sp. NSM TaxID=3457630 RepID=UPI004036703C
MAAAVIAGDGIEPPLLLNAVAHFESDIRQPAFWLSFSEINVVFSGDNALVIAR